LSRKRARAAANFQSVQARFRNMLKQEMMVMVVMRPTAVIEKRQSIEIFFNRGHF
jgi:hypothetical protein